MRNELMTYAMVGLLAFAGILITGCDPNPAQIKAIANQAGLFSSVGWIAMDNPEEAVKTNVKAVIVLIKEKADKVDEGKTYTEVLYPLVLDYVVKSVEPQYRPLTKAGSLAVLSGIDMLFAANPAWATEKDLAVDIIQSFCGGAVNGLSLGNDDPIMKAAARSAKMRSDLQLHK